MKNFVKDLPHNLSNDLQYDLRELGTSRKSELIGDRV